MRDLIDVLSSEVEVTNAHAVLDVELDDPVLDDDPNPENIDTEFVQTEEIPCDEPPKAMPFSHIGELLVGVFDMVQTASLPAVRKKVMFTAKEIELLDTMDVSGETPYPKNSPESKILAKWNKYLIYVDKITLTDKERTFLVSATERYAATVNMQLTPLQGLLAAYGVVLGSRLQPIAADVF